MSRRVMNHLRLTIKTENLDEKPYFHRTTFGAPLHLAHNWFCVASPITPPPVYANVLPSIEPVELEASLSPIPHQPAYIDLISPTAEPSSPIMPSSPVRPGVASSGTTKRRHEETSSTPSSASSSRPAKVRRLDYTPKRDASPSTDPGKDAEVIDLIEYVSYDEYREKKLLAADKKRMAADAVRPMRLADFQCIICMDQPTDLTVTHCGHLFCSECLNCALYIPYARKTCPVCRTSIVPDTPNKKNGRNGVYVLELKCMTSNMMGKRKDTDSASFEY